LEEESSETIDSLNEMKSQLEARAHLIAEVDPRIVEDYNARKNQVRPPNNDRLKTWKLSLRMKGENPKIFELEWIRH
jgi:hypothetical protein